MKIVCLAGVLLPLFAIVATKGNSCNRTSPAKFTRVKKGMTKQDGES